MQLDHASNFLAHGLNVIILISGTILVAAKSNDPGCLSSGIRLISVGILLFILSRLRPELELAILVLVTFIAFSPVCQIDNVYVRYAVVSLWSVVLLDVVLWIHWIG
jgi:hypothetical protein